MPGAVLDQIPKDMLTTFRAHVKESCLSKFSPLYFTVGLVEEIAEMEEQLARDPLQIEQVVSEAGDVLWYLVGLCDALEDICLALPGEETDAEVSAHSLLLAVG